MLETWTWAPGLRLRSSKWRKRKRLQGKMEELMGMRSFTTSNMRSKSIVELKTHSLQILHGFWSWMHCKIIHFILVVIVSCSLNWMRNEWEWNQLKILFTTKYWQETVISSSGELHSSRIHERMTLVCQFF